MPLIPERLLAHRFEPIRLAMTPRDAMLYALGVGFGTDPLDRGQLRFLYEDGLAVVPTHVNQMAGGAWLVGNAAHFGATASGIMQGEQAFTSYEAVPPDADLLIEQSVRDVVDKGEGRGALIYSDAEVRDAVDGRHYATLRSTVMCRHDGGFGGNPVPASPLPIAPVPDRVPDIVCDLPTLVQSALIYRLSGDYHKLHVDPDFAQAAGFERPILHGKCTMGVAGHAILRTCCDYDPARLLGMACRFSAPVFPGETIRTEIWREGHRAHFRSSVVERGVVVLGNGTAMLA